MFREALCELEGFRSILREKGWKFMDKYDLRKAYLASSHNREALRHEKKCGCFYCLRVYSSKEIIEWITEKGEEVTPICPYCGVDAVIPESAGSPLDKPFLEAMKNYWF